MLHDPYGEDGTIQGLFEMADVPYVGAGVTASALGMDKALMKTLFKAKSLPVVKHLILLESEWKKNRETILKKIKTEATTSAALSKNISGLFLSTRREEREFKIEILIEFD